jgi:peptidoglycan/LPS O-acetylase OafA/YrhL
MPGTFRFASTQTVPAIRERREAHGNNFDFLRLAAALAVIFSHSFTLTDGSDVNEPLFRLSGQQATIGLVAVDMFFIISGFLVTQSFCRLGHPFAFLRNRALRILPGLAAAALFCAFVIGPIATALPLADYFSRKGAYSFIVNSLLFARGQSVLPGVFADNPFAYAVNGSLWTLRFEVLCYFAVFALGSAGLLRASILIPLFAGLVMARATGFGGPYTMFGAAFAGGATLCIVRDRLQPDGRTAALCAIALLSAFLAGGYSIAAPLAGAYLVYWLALTPALRLPAIGSYGDFSYGLYIYAFPVQQMTAHLGADGGAWFINFALSLTATLPLAWLSWHAIERPALRAKLAGDEHFPKPESASGAT